MDGSSAIYKCNQELKQEEILTALTKTNEIYVALISGHVPLLELFKSFLNAMLHLLKLGCLCQSLPILL